MWMFAPPSDPGPTLVEQPPAIGIVPTTATAPDWYDVPASPPPVPEVDHLIGWNNLNWGLHLGIFVLLPVILMALSWWLVGRVWRSNRDEAKTALVVACSALLSLIAVPALHIVLGFQIARHCTRPAYVLAMFAAALVVQIGCYGLLVRRGLVRIIVAVVARVSERGWAPSWRVTIAPPVALILTDIVLALADTLYRAAAALGVSIGGFLMLIAGALWWLWSRASDDGSVKSSGYHGLRGARIAPVIGNGNTIYQGDLQDVISVSNSFNPRRTRLVSPVNHCGCHLPTPSRSRRELASTTRKVGPNSRLLLAQ